MKIEWQRIGNFFSSPHGKLYIHMCVCCEHRPNKCMRGTYMRIVRNIPSSVLLELFDVIDNVSQRN